MSLGQCPKKPRFPSALRMLAEKRLKREEENREMSKNITEGPVQNKAQKQAEQARERVEIQKKNEERKKQEIYIY